MRTITRRTFLLLALPLVAFAFSSEKEKVQSKYLVYVGTYTTNGSKGIYSYSFDPRSGQLTELGLAAETENPSFLTLDPTHRFLYAVNEVQKYKDESSGGVSAFAIERATGKLTFLNEVASGGADPCYVALDKSGKYVLVANYTGGSVAVFPVNADGSLGTRSALVQHQGSGPNKERQEGPHAHWIETTGDNRYAIAADLGLDELVVYHFDVSKGALAANDPPFAKVEAGAGPRHVGFHPNGRFAYVINELQSTVSAFAYDAVHGRLNPLESISTLPKDFSAENTTAEIEVHPSGKFLYASNRGHDSIAAFAIDPQKGTLRLVDYFSTKGRTPRNFAIDPTGSWLLVANQNTGNMVVFRIDRKTGRLTAKQQEIKVPSPVCLKFLRH
ncbi:MAG TPA: lactonase family protein [Terriglobales bacterium]|nr:lactonase family protein [Terriglobales bacterium]